MTNPFKQNAFKILNAISIILIVATIIGIFSYVAGRKRIAFQTVTPSSGVVNVCGADLNGDLYWIDNNWDFYLEKLYTPKDFADKNTVEPISVRDVLGSKTLTFGTYRVILKAEPNKYYSICGYGIDYATRVYVGGVEIRNIGNVAESAEKSVPKTGYMTIPVYTGESGEVEIIYQFSNFVHKEGGTIPPTLISTPENIERYKTDNNLMSLLFGGALLVFSLYFLFNAALQRRVEYLALAFCTVLAALCDQTFFTENLLTLAADWYVSYRFTVLISSLLPFAILFLLQSLYTPNKKYEKVIMLVYCAFAAVLATLHFCIDSVDLVTLCKCSYFIAVPYCLFLLYSVTSRYFRQKKFALGDFLTLSGYLLLGASLLYDALTTNQNTLLTRNGIVPIGTLLFILFISAAIGLKVRKDELALLESRNKSEMLEQMNEMNKEFLRNVAHELKTPLTVISGYAQLTNMQFERNVTDSDTPNNLKTIQNEAMRLGNIVTTLTDYAEGKTTDLVFERVAANKVFESVLAICEPICKKKNNTLTVGCNGELFVTASRDTLVQICVNLVVNANKHTENGAIEVLANCDEASSMVIFRVTDNGKGILPSVAEHIFERGYSADGDSGLGLAIAKAAVEMHKGAISLEKSDENGTAFAFTIPKTEE